MNPSDCGAVFFFIRAKSFAFAWKVTSTTRHQDGMFFFPVFECLPRLSCVLLCVICSRRRSSSSPQLAKSSHRSASCRFWIHLHMQMPWILICPKYILNCSLFLSERPRYCFMPLDCRTLCICIRGEVIFFTADFCSAALFVRAFLMAAADQIFPRTSQLQILDSINNPNYIITFFLIIAHWCIQFWYRSP